jgi:ATP synthase F1 epsilon subunit
MKLEILSFNWKLFKSESVSSVTAVTRAWEITLLNNHSALITSLKPSVLKVIYSDSNNMNQIEYFAIWWGLLETSNNNTKILIDMLVWVEDVNADIAQKAREEALSLMEKYKDSKDKVDMERFIQAEDMLLKSIAQLKLSEIK